MSKKALVIAGSAGSFVTVSEILRHIPKKFPYPVFVVLHRLRSVKKGLLESLQTRSRIKLWEPEDHEPVKGGMGYLAPANYHMLPGKENIALSIDKPVNHSRPSIDVAFCAAAEEYGEGLVAILLSGANSDGGAGCAAIKAQGGTVVVQHPDDCEIPVMTQSALKQTNVDFVLHNDKIIELVRSGLITLFDAQNG